MVSDMKIIYAQDDIELATIKQRILHGRARISTFFCGVLKNIPRVSLSTRLMLHSANKITIFDQSEVWKVHT